VIEPRPAKERHAAVEGWLREQAGEDPRVIKMRSHPGVGLLTSLALMHTLEPVSRFRGSDKDIA
jgi:hypothetical protein